MSVNSILAKRIFDVTKGYKGKFLMLGRQDWVTCRDNKFLLKYFNELVSDLSDLPNNQSRKITEADFYVDEDSKLYSDPAFKLMGFDTVDSLDASDFENSTIVHNLGKKIPISLSNKFDVIYDGGTLEHIFNYPRALLNVDQMLKPNGIFIAHTPSNNFHQHGFYQICPEVFYSFLVQMLGYEMIGRPYYAPLRPAYAHKHVYMTNPLETGKRPRLRGEMTGFQTILVAALRKSGDEINEVDDIDCDELFANVYQSDYYARWEE